ncbi:MAG: WD40 repeat [Glomeribacter sp. 1016415]|nr:WD40 repeat [Glomeribacter sp. 1016415]
MSPINPSQNTLPSLASYFPQIASSFSSTQARTDDSSESNLQIGNGLMNNLVIGTNNTANNHIYLAASDSKLLETLMLQHIFALQPNTAPLANLDLTIEKLRKEYLRGLQEDNEIKDALSNYVAPEGMGLYDSTRFDLKSKVQDFLNSDKKVLLLLGEAGSGKSTFNRDLAVSLWEAYTQKDKTKDTPIPVFIGLSSLSGPDRNLVSAFFEKQGFSKEQIKELQSKYRFVLILDGFDEIEHRQQVFYRDNELDDWKGSKIIISSRPEYLGPNYQYKFHPSGERTALQEYRLAPFSDETIKRYIDCYSETYPHAVWSAERYKEALDESNLKELVSNPFLLKITLSVLPELSQRGQVKNQRLTRIAIYDQFVKSWFDRSQQRLDQILEVGSKERKEFKDLEREGFAGFGVDFSKELALAMYQAGEVITHYQAVTHARWKKNDTSTEADWRKRLLSNEDTTTVLMRLNAPLICQDRPNDSGKEYRFIHKSLRDYFVARALWEELKKLSVVEQSNNSNPLSVMKETRTLWEALSDSVRVDPSALFNTLNVVEDPAVQSFVVERVRQERVLIQPLLGWIKASKTEKGVSAAAANAITVLVSAGVQLNGIDLKGIQIPGADLSFGVFDSAQLQGADLTKVKLHNSWLRQANLSGAQMAGVQFGERPLLQESSGVNSCAYSPDGKTFAAGLTSGGISVYTISDWQKIWTLRGHRYQVNNIAYSPDSTQIATGSDDKTVRLWDLETCAILRVFDHSDKITSVIYSPKGDQLASGSLDETIWLWDLKTGAGRILTSSVGRVRSIVYSPDGNQIGFGSHDTALGVMLLDVRTGMTVRCLLAHSRGVTSVVYSLRGNQLASGSLDHTVRLWDLKTGATIRILIGHSSGVMSVVYSPDGAQLASGSLDDTVRVWDMETGASRHILNGHLSGVNSIVYSPDGTQIASGSSDDTVRVWDIQTAVTRHALISHRDMVSSVVYSPDGAQLVSGSLDDTVRVWDVETGTAHYTLSGHAHGVYSVAYSPKGDQIASGGNYRYPYTSSYAIQLFDIKTGDGHTLYGHTDTVRSVAYAPDGALLVSGSWDKTVRLWDVETGAVRHILSGHSHFVNSVAYSPDGTQIASGSHDETILLWDAQTGAIRHILSGHSGAVTSVVYSSKGDQLVSGSEDSTVRLWDVETGTVCYTLNGHKGPVYSVIYSPKGDQLASGGYDHTVRLWDVETGRCQRIIQSFDKTVQSIAWKEASNGHYLVTGSEDNAVRQWRIIQEGDSYKALLCWSSAQTALMVSGTSIQDVRGLSPVNQQLLKQRGAGSDLPLKLAS